MKLEVGMYVRTTKGISKLIEIEEYHKDNVKGINYIFDRLDEELWSSDLCNLVWEIDLWEVVERFSHNIIDLIEVGDYVNRDKVTCITEENIYTEDDQLVYIKDRFRIKSIVTKEQFKSMEYKVVQDNENIN